MTILEKALLPLRRRMKLQRTMEWGIIGLCIGIAAMVLLRAASFIWPFPTVWRWSFAALIGIPILCMLVSHLWPVSAMDAARRVDVSGLQARAQTALMLKDSDMPMAVLQRQDTLNRLSGVRPAQVFPLRIPRTALIAMGACVLLLGLSFLVVNPQDNVLRARAEFESKMDQQAELVEEGAVKLDAEDEQTPELRKVLGDLSTQLRRASDPRDALTAVDEAERRIEAMRMNTGKDAINALNQSNQSALANALKAENAAEAEQLLSQMDKQEVADALEAAAQAAQSAAAANALSAAAQAMLNADLSEALSQLQAAASGLTGVTLQAAALSNMVRMAAANAGAMQAALLTAGQQGTGGSGSGAGSSAAIGMAAGTGMGAGTGSSNKDKGYSGSPTSRVSNTGSREGSMKVEEYEAIYDPTRLNAQGETVASKGKVGEGEITEMTVGAGIGSAGESVPYNQVLTEYQETAVTAAQNAQLPTYAQQWVQDYFGALADD